MPADMVFNPESLSAEQIVECNVRPILQAGGEPFSAIMTSIAAVPEGGAMKLLATFKPAPLFNVLGGKGWSHWIEKGEGDDWVIWFFKAVDVSSENPGKPVAHEKAPKADIVMSFLQRDNPELQSRLSAQDKQWILEVRQMVPPEPMELTLIVLDKLPKDYTLVQLNCRIPQFLLPLLEERGFKYEITKNEEEEVRIEIKHA